MSMALITLIGYVGKDAELRYTQSGQAVANFSVGCDVRSGGETKTQWYDVSMWAKMAESLQPYVLKGTPVTVFGKPALETFTDRNGQERAKITVMATEVQLQGRAADGGGNQASGQQGPPQGQQRPPQGQQRPPQGAQRPPQGRPPAQAPQGGGYDPLPTSGPSDDDIPF